MTKKTNRKTNRIPQHDPADVEAAIEQALTKGASHLDLSRRGLTELPSSICTLTQLRSLDLDFNGLNTLPSLIGNLTNLEELNIGYNRLTKLPESILKLSRLKSLFFSDNQITELPKFIGEMTQLRQLYAAGLHLTDLPDTLRHLVRLERLVIARNPFNRVPIVICDMTWLKALFIWSTGLTEVPDCIGELSQLEILHLNENNLGYLPETMRNLRCLKELELHDNDGLGIPAEVLGAKWNERIRNDAEPAKPAEILDYYFRVRQGRRSLNEAKLILVGRGAVGKTSIVNQLVHQKFKNEKKTDGIKITEWKLRLNNNEDVRLNVWDFGGQEIMHATHQFFLTQRSLYLLVVNGREGGEDADAEYWLKLIESFGGDSPVIVILNKIKEHPFDVNRRALQQKYPVIRDFIKTDCKDGIGLEQLRRTVERETDRLEHLRDPFPASWFTIKDHLAGMKKNYLSFEEFRKESARLGEKDSVAQESLATYLHILGIALNYSDDPRLQDTHVLNPRWVTNGIYKILNSDKLEKQKGEISLIDLPAILESKTYPKKMHRFLIDLMKKFELCFSYLDDDAHYLIPELLDKQEAQEAEGFKAEACLNFQYHYPVLPEGLLPRFIVRTHVLSEGLPRWRTGVILSFEGNRALVKADLQDKRVFISVSGAGAGRRRLLAIIRSDFDRIHRDIRNLHPREMIPLPGYPEVVVPYQELLVMEQSGIIDFPKVVGTQVVSADVNELLNGVDIDRTRRRSVGLDRHKRGISLFYSYSHRDESFRNELDNHLKLLQRSGLIDTWHDRKIESGEDWKQRIDDNLERAQIILLLVSSDFIASDYCYEKEMKRALERHEMKEARVIPIIVRDVNWKTAPFAKLQALPKDGQAISTWANRDSAWRNVSEGIERVLGRISAIK